VAERPTSTGAVASIQVTPGAAAPGPLMAETHAASAEIIAKLVIGAQDELGGTEPLEPRVVALTMRGAINDAVARLRGGPDSDPPAHLDRDGRQIADLIERSLRAGLRPRPEGAPR
jgi:hypothetical protein